MTSNGDIDKAELEALKEAPTEQKLDYVLTCTFKTKRAVDRLPQMIEAALRKQRNADFRRIATLCAVIAAVISTATPIVLHFV
ncbi:MAG TPA: hypothetical protein VFH61_14835 [Thermoleophilia bacterium]|nr:hypothetical protein [Thermoleophilia bacterium]